MLRSRAADRALGKVWERAFADLCAQNGRRATLHHPAYAERRGNDYEPSAAFDVSVLHKGGDEHHEIKHKSATNRGRISWERYRLEKLIDLAKTSSARTFYTVHRWDKAPGGRDGTENRIQHWYTIEAKHLVWLVVEGFVDQFEVPTYYNRGDELVKMPAYSWNERYWMPLADLWRGERNPCFLPDDEWLKKLSIYRPSQAQFARDLKLP